MRRRKNPFRGVYTSEDRHGKLRHRLRRTIKGRTIDCYINAPYGSPEFRAAYEEAIEGARQTTLRTKPGTIAYLIANYLQSTAFRNLKMATRQHKARRLDWIREIIGEARYTQIKPQHVEQLLRKKPGPVAGNRVKKDLAQLFRHAAKYHGYTSPNPAALAEANKVRSSGFHTWSDEEVETFRATHPTGSKARLALELLLNTGAARQDAAAMTRANIRGPRLHYARGKTREQVIVPIMPELARELAHLPADQMMLLAHGNHGKGYGAASFGNWFKEQCEAAGLSRCTAHGLRKAGATALAQAGATESEIAAFLGHASTREAARYTQAANRSRLTDSAMAKLSTEPEQKLTNLSERLVKEGRQAADV